MESSRRAAVSVFLTISFVACIPLANWLISAVGTKCIPAGPCLVPVWPGVLAPSGVLLIGLALVLRDAVHSLGGIRLAFAAIALGGLMSLAIAPPALAIASVCAFVLGELADLAVYAPLRRRHLVWAVLASGAAGAIVDSALFLWLAFGSLDYLAGQIIGKAWATLAVVVWLAWRARRAGACA